MTRHQWVRGPVDASYGPDILRYFFHCKRCRSKVSVNYLYDTSPTKRHLVEHKIDVDCDKQIVSQVMET
jgi:hypothetical protein